ncbi:hypothetical protein F503_01926 [Ophiostoma piceae UAMH 11346]|uniref:Uncharacterized protein n=1 Tax=Ophiostoma piceae (strain UAMH 11346) TaxID=1262450 RepID=S3CBP5_OPHP1|nr:hypothetical protein F503_01926 [Ophiostoma piceae UAMH 11346]
MLPVLEVSRLSSASSFYSAVTQSLGLGYLADYTPNDNNPPPSANSSALVKHNLVVVFGDEYSDSPVFQLRQVDNRPIHPSTIVLSANSLDAVNAFHAAALRAFPRSAAVIGTKESLNPSPENHKHIIPSIEDYFSSSAPQSHAGPASSTIVARISDFDGNTMAVEYYPYQQSSSSHYGGGRSSRHYDASRVLDYSTSATSPSMFSPRYGSSGATALTTASSRHRGTVAASEMPAYYGHYSSSRNDRMGTLRRSATSASAASYESDPSTSSSNKGGIGAFGLAAAGAVGAMAGAAFTYTVMRSRSQSRGASARELPYEYDCNYNEASYEDPVPSFQRRETAPAAIAYEPEYAASHYTSRDNGGMRTSRTRSIASQKDLRHMEDVYDYKDAASAAPPPSYHTSVRYSKAPSASGRSSRSRSEAPLDRAPLMLTNGSDKGGLDGYDYGNGYDAYEKGGYEKSGYEKSGYEKSGYDKYDSKHDKYDKRSYVSERTERSRMPPNSSRSAPLRPPVYAPSNVYSQQPSQAPSRRSRSSSRSRSHSYQEYASPDSATLPCRDNAQRHRGYAPQPHRSDRSARGSSHARYEEDDQYGGYDDDGDADSVGPDDSISCVGSRGRYR